MKKSFRSTLIDSIMENAETHPNMVVLNADSARALKLTDFQAAYPDRMFGVGISEADLIGTAARDGHHRPDPGCSRILHVCI